MRALLDPTWFEAIEVAGMAVCLLGLAFCTALGYFRIGRPEDAGVGRAASGSAAAGRDLSEPEVVAADAVVGTAESPVTPTPTPRAAPTVAAAPRAPSWRQGLQKTRAALLAPLEKLLLGRSTLDAETLDRVEDLLFGADLGTRTAQQLLDAVRTAESPDGVREILRERAVALLSAVEPAQGPAEGSPHVILVCGVNGSGKTTSIGKLARRYASAGRPVILAAADTFRAAAIDQLAIWAERAGVDLVRGAPGGDPAAIAFDAVAKARAQARPDAVVLIDTAGRLQTDQSLMDELRKISRVVQKELPEAPHEVLLVLDANTGQNAIRQAQEFQRAVQVTGLVLTKLDGTAKGGVILGVVQEVGTPVRYVGLGEGIDDLADFDRERFVEALFAQD